MRFYGTFVCKQCGQEFTIDLGPQKMGELSKPRVIGKFIGEIAIMFAKSCLDHEQECSVPKAVTG